MTGAEGVTEPKVAIDGLKWPGSPYRSMQLHRLGEDEAGTWLWAPRGTPSAYIGRDPQPLPVDFLMLVAEDEWWRATWMFGGELELYVDIGCPPEWAAVDHIRVIDLDLDVIRWNDGRCEIDDEDEFAEHQVSLRYPPDVIATARRAADEVLEQVRAGAAPFGPAPAHWLDRAGRMGSVRIW